MTGLISTFPVATYYKCLNRGAIASSVCLYVYSSQASTTFAKKDAAWSLFSQKRSRERLNYKNRMRLSDISKFGAEEAAP
ncbi:hypothetical protein N7523_005555 [Penicillium sp. IBT 18751x]|nr:hypothetical protein N7523_005860 [Penicillium sp. IBT 18751x]KAJ6117804.1 hypothetical protein N7523_005555 [Penicillium sp. IBT 18751x]